MANPSFQDFVQQLPQAFQAERAAGINAVVCVHLAGEQAGDWTLTIQDKQCSLVAGAPANPRLTLSADSKDMVDILSGKLDGVRAFMLGKIKISGDMNLALQLMNLFKLS